MMKKSILAIAVASLAVSTAAMAESTVYGQIHLSLNQADNDIPGADNNLSVSSNTSAIGVKGSEDLGDGLKAIYQLEFQVAIGEGPTINPDGGTNESFATGTLSGRDQFVGLKGGLGTVKFGTMSSNYKQTGGKVDPLYRTPLEGRGFLGMQSSTLHGGIGLNRGRQTHTAQYVSPKFGGIELVANTTFSGSEEETMGAGLRWSNKNIMAYIDWIDAQSGTPDQPGTNDTESAVKVGGQFKGDMFSVGFQYEDAADRDNYEYIFLAGTYSFNKNNDLILTYGMASADVVSATADDYDSIALAYNHKLSKMTNVYVGYGMRSNDATFDATSPGTTGDVSMITAGIKKKF